jgi:hypothetical protein
MTDIDLLQRLIYNLFVGICHPDIPVQVRIPSEANQLTHGKVYGAYFIREHNGHRPGVVLFFRFTEAVENDLTSNRLLQACQGPYQSRLSDTVWSHEAHQLACLQGKVKVLEKALIFGGVPNFQGVHLK